MQRRLQERQVDRAYLRVDSLDTVWSRARRRPLPYSGCISTRAVLRLLGLGLSCPREAKVPGIRVLTGLDHIRSFHALYNLPRSARLAQDKPKTARPVCDRLAGQM